MPRDTLNEMRAGFDTTRSFSTGNASGVTAGPAAAQLVCALDCANPLAPPARFSLADVDVVELGRGDERTAERIGRTLSITLPDAWMSSAHARMTRSGTSWQLRDLGSKNGTRIGGGTIRKVTLVDEDVIVIGRMLWVFRAAHATAPGEAADVDAALFHGQPLALATLSSKVDRELCKLASVAPSALPVLISGETGTGKELTARAVHELSGRTGRFIAVNCGALPAELVEAELFGAVRGAFTGADANRTGLVRAADGGTLFLDEVAELPLPAQAALLRTMQDGEVRPVGATEAQPTNLRIVAATNQNLPALVATKRFRADLYARLAGHTVWIPPVRHRREDIGLFVAAALAARAPSVELTLGAGQALFDYQWPMNVRELVNCLASAVALAAGDPIAREHLPPPVRAATPAQPGRPAAGRVTREQLVALLTEHKGNVSAVARALATARAQVRRLATRFDVDIASFRDDGAPS